MVEFCPCAVEWYWKALKFHNAVIVSNGSKLGTVIRLGNDRCCCFVAVLVPIGSGEDWG